MSLPQKGRVQLKCDGTWWCMGGEVKGKLANGVGSQPVPFTLPRNLVYPALLSRMRTPRLPAVDWTDALADLNGLLRFAERPKLVSARVPSPFKRTLQSERRGINTWGTSFHYNVWHSCLENSSSLFKNNEVCHWTLHALFLLELSAHFLCATSLAYHRWLDEPCNNTWKIQQFFF